MASSSPAIAPFSYPSSSSNSSSKAGGDDLLTADLGKNDYDWLLTPPGSPPADPIDQHPSHHHDGNVDDLLSAAALPNLVRSLAAIKTSRLAGPKSDPSNKKDSSLFSTRLDPSLRSSWGTLTRSASTATGSPFSGANGNSRRGSLPGSLSRPSSRPSTPTKKSSPFSVSSASSSATTTTVSRPTTPTNRSKPSSSRPTTPTNRSNSRIDSSFRPSPSPSPARPSSTSRPATPVRRLSSPAPPSPTASSAAPPRSSSITKGRPIPSRSTPPSLNSSPTLKPVAHHHAWEQLSAIPGFNLEPPPNLRTTNVPRSSSNSRGSTVGSLSRPAATGTTSKGNLYENSDAVARRSSPSPARTRSSFPSASPTPMLTRSSSKQERSPMDASIRSTKMVDKSNAPSRKSISSPETLVSTSHTINVAVKPNSPTAGREASGHARSFLRKPVEFSAWNKDIRGGGTTANGLHSLVSNVPASSLYSVRPAATRAQPDSFPTALDGGASSAYGRNSVGHDPELASKDVGKQFVSEFSSKASLDGEFSSKASLAAEFSSKASLAGGEFGSKASPASGVDSISSLLKDSRANDWLGSPDYKKEHHPEQISSNVSESEPPATCRHGSVASSCEICMMKLRLQRLTEKCRASLTASFQVSNNIFKGGLSGNAVSSGHR